MSNTLSINNRIGAIFCRASAWMVVCFIAYLFGAGSVSPANASNLNRATGVPATVDPWGIKIYPQPNFGGGSISYKMEPGMRQKLVPQIAPGWEDKVVSIEIGSSVGVFLFAGHDFYAGSNSDCGYFTQSIAKIVDFKVGSLIVYPKAANGPFGVWLCDVRSGPPVICCGPNENVRERTFFPLAEPESSVSSVWSFLGKFNLDKNANQIEFDTRYVQVTLYEEQYFQGESLTLPRAGLSHPQYVSWKFDGMGWSDRAASLRVTWIGVRGMGPPSFTVKYNADLPGNDLKGSFTDGGWEDCQKSCSGEPKCVAFTWVEPGIQGEKAACWLKSSVSTAIYHPKCVSGYTGNPPAEASPRTFNTEQGVDRPGSDYKHFVVHGGAIECQKACESDPTCKAFTWVEPEVARLGGECWLKSSVPAATSNPKCVTGYTGSVQPGPLPSGQGGATFTPDISGNWQSSIGTVYKITQSGNQFTWKVKNGNEQASGALTGLQISASWSGGAAAGSGKGKVIVDESGKAIRIEWDNGVIFLRG